MLPVFENIFDVVEFLVHHFPVGFQTIEHRLEALKIVKEANPLTAEREKAHQAQIAAERQKDTGRTDAAVYDSAPANSGFSQDDLDAAVAKAVAAALSAVKAADTAPSLTPARFETDASN